MSEPTRRPAYEYTTMMIDPSDPSKEISIADWKDRLEAGATDWLAKERLMRAQMDKLFKRFLDG